MAARTFDIQNNANGLVFGHCIISKAVITDLGSSLYEASISFRNTSTGEVKTVIKTSDSMANIRAILATGMTTGYYLHYYISIGWDDATETGNIDYVKRIFISFNSTSAGATTEFVSGNSSQGILDIQLSGLTGYPNANITTIGTASTYVVMSQGATGTARLNPIVTAVSTGSIPPAGSEFIVTFGSRINVVPLTVAGTGLAIAFTTQCIFYTDNRFRIQRYITVA